MEGQMQRTATENNINAVSRVRIFFGGLFWIMGLLAAGSEGAGMPWVNLAGLCVFLSSSLLLGKWFNQIGKTRSWTSKRISRIRKPGFPSARKKTAQILVF